MRKHASPIEQRKEQIAKQLDHIHGEFASKTPKHYKNDSTFEQKRRQRLDLIAELENELSILQDPGEYNEFPAAVVAEELGLTLAKVKSLFSKAERLLRRNKSTSASRRVRVASACMRSPSSWS